MSACIVGRNELFSGCLQSSAVPADPA